MGNAFSRILSYHDIIIVKSCYTASSIKSDEQLEKYKKYYINIRKIITKYPNKIFILMTPPPRNNRADSEYPRYNDRAAKFCNWLLKESYAGNIQNFFVFDLAGYLRKTDKDSVDFNGLKRVYQISDDNSHPNQNANVYIRPLFVDFVVDAIEQYRNTIMKR